MNAASSKPLDASAAVAMPKTSVLPQPRSALTFEVPRGACNCHVHVTGPLDRYPQVPSRHFTVDPVPIDEARAMLAALHMDRVVIIPQIVTGTDHSYVIAALRELGSNARAVAILDRSDPDSRIRELEEIGFRAARVILHEPGQIDDVLALAERLQLFGWHIETYGALSFLGAHKRRLADLPVPLVLDHFAGIQAALGTGQPGFAELLDLLRAGKVYVKLSGAYRCSAQAPTYPDVAPIVRALIEANSDRLIWGGDWPHPGISIATLSTMKRDDRLPWFDLDDAVLLDALAAWVGDRAVLRKILVDNPARLYRFDGAE